jgi:hypothetical protein
MSTFIGNTQPNNYYIGNTPLSALYVGANKIWPVGQEVAWFDFGNTTSFPSSASTTVFNISANKNYVAGNINQFNVISYTSGTPLQGRQDPSGSGTYMPISASGATTAIYLANAGGTLFAVTASTFSFETWVRPLQKKADGNTWLAGPGHSAVFSAYNQWQFGFSNVGTNDGAMLVLQNKSLTTLNTIQSASTAPNTVDFNRWNHLVYTLQRNPTGASTFTLYKNGVQQTIIKNNFTESLVSVASSLISPGWTNTLAFSLFDLSMMRMYNKVLDGAEVVSLFEATRARYSI